MHPKCERKKTLWRSHLGGIVYLVNLEVVRTTDWGGTSMAF